MQTNYNGVIQPYSNWCARRGDADETVTRKRRVALRWLAHIGDGWPAATYRDIESYGDQRGLAAASWAQELSMIRGFYRWAQREGLAHDDPTLLADHAPVRQRLPRPVSELEYSRLVTDAGPRMTAVLELMAWCGLRCAEVAALRWADVDVERRSAIVRGKGGRERLVGLPGRVVRALAAIDGPTAHVIVRNDGYTPFTAARISHMVTERAAAAGVKVSAHRLRHTYATRLVRHGSDLGEVQYALGHVSISTTQIYAKLDERKVTELARRLDELERADPRLF